MVFWKRKSTDGRQRQSCDGLDAAVDTVKARGGDSARSDDLSTCSAKAYHEGSDSPRAVGAFSRFSDGATASSFTSNDDTAAAQQDGQPMQDDAISQEEEQLADWEIPEHQLTICRRPDGKMWLLGEGSYGKVWKAVWHKADGTEVDVAMKMTIISPEAARRRSLCDRLEADFIREMALMKYLCSNDSHVVPFHGACVYEGRLCLVLELMKGGDLTDAIRGSRNGEFGWFGKGRNIAINVAKGLAFLHSNRIVHCDLKSKNIMLTANAEAKISDVGLSKMMHAGAGDHSGSGDACFGTFAWAAPEMLMGEDPTPAADIYSFGVVLWEICCQEMPQRGRRRDPTPSEAPLEVAAIIQTCLRFKPEQRPSAKEVVALLELVAEMERPPVPAGPPPAASSGTGVAAYRATIEDSARRLHAGSARRRSYDARASIDVRRAAELTSMEKSMSSLMARSSGLYNPSSLGASPLTTAASHKDGGDGGGGGDSQKSGGSVRRGGQWSARRHSANAAQLHLQPPARGAVTAGAAAPAPSPFAAAGGPAFDDAGPAGTTNDGAKPRRASSIPMAQPTGSAIAASSSLYTGFAAAPARLPSTSPTLSRNASPSAELPANAAQLTGIALAASSSLFGSLTAPAAAAAAAPPLQRNGSPPQPGARQAAGGERTGGRADVVAASTAGPAAGGTSLYSSFLAHAPAIEEQPRSTSMPTDAQRPPLAMAAAAATASASAASSSLYSSIFAGIPADAGKPAAASNAGATASAPPAAASSLYSDIFAGIHGAADATPAAGSDLQAAMASAPAAASTKSSSLYSDLLANIPGIARADVLLDVGDDEPADAAAVDEAMAARTRPLTVDEEALAQRRRRSMEHAAHNPFAAAAALT